MNGYFKMVAVADLHFGQPRIDAESMYKKLKKFLYPELRDAHLIFVCGDIYDQLLTVNSKSHLYASKFIADLFKISDATGMQVRILHGTFTHDRDQLSVFETLATKRTRYKIINQIDCEEITDFRNGMDTVGNMTLRVGYIPDNLVYRTSDEVLDHLKRVMSCFGWNRLDMICGHGSFDHVLKADAGHLPPCLYSISQFDMVDGPLVMGHIHSPGRTRNCYYCGSFERMSHGEEENKGFYTFTRDAKNIEGWRGRFVVNPLATPFISITPEGNDIPEITRNYLAQLDEKFPNRVGFVRVLHESPEIRSLLHKITVQQFPELSYTSKSTGTKDIVEMKMEDITLDIFDDVKPDIHNLGELVYKFLEERHDLEHFTKDLIVERTNELLTSPQDM